MPVYVSLLYEQPSKGRCLDLPTSSSSAQPWVAAAWVAVAQMPVALYGSLQPVNEEGELCSSGRCRIH
jgi:hypothetical protein